MKYIKVEWRHDDPSEPFLLLSEITADGWEVRKIEAYRDGRCDYASSAGSSGSTELGEMPVPELSTINADSQFFGIEISKVEFETRWECAVSISK